MDCESTMHSTLIILPASMPMTFFRVPWRICPWSSIRRTVMDPSINFFLSSTGIPGSRAMISRNFVACFNRFITENEQCPTLSKGFYHSTNEALNDKQLICFISFSRFKNRNCLSKGLLRNEISGQICFYRVVRLDGLPRTFGVVVGFARSNQKRKDGEKGKFVHICCGLF